MLSNKIVKKVNQIRKKNWSAPTIMSAFLFACMIFIYSFESMGLLNKEKNLDWRISTPERVIKTVGEIKVKDVVTSSKEGLSEISEKVLIDKLKKVTAKNKEENYEQMMKILIDGANNQIQYITNEAFDINDVNNISSNAQEAEIDFFDV